MKRDFHVPYISRRNFLQRFGSATLGTTRASRSQLRECGRSLRQRLSLL